MTVWNKSNISFEGCYGHLFLLFNIFSPLRLPLLANDMMDRISGPFRESEPHFQAPYFAMKINGQNLPFLAGDVLVEAHISHSDFFGDFSLNFICAFQSDLFENNGYWSGFRVPSSLIFLILPVYYFFQKFVHFLMLSILIIFVIYIWKYCIIIIVLSVTILF